MHSYSTDESKVAAYGVIAVVAVVLAWAVVALLSPLSWPEWLIAAPSVTGTFAFAYAVFDRWFWRTRPARMLGLTKTPNLEGVYKGHLTSNYKDDDGKQVSHPITLEVCQSWTRLSAHMTVGSATRTSTSVSYMGAISLEGTSARLSYCYRNEINPANADADMGDHVGAADLVVNPSGSVSGRYYNSRPRTGSIQAERRMT